MSSNTRSSSGTRPADSGFIAHVAIEASAGSGKTYRLAHRYTDLLLSGADPASVLAVTFTRKAAGEILSRALRTVVSKVRDGEPERLLRHVAETGERLAVGTLDSFFARMAGGLALDLGVAPGWRIADADADAELAQASAERIIAEFGVDQAMLVVRALCDGRSPSSPLDAILRAVRAVEGEFDAASVAVGGTSAWQLTNLPSLERLASVDGPTREAWAKAMESAPLPTTKGGEKDKRFVKAITNAAGAVRAGDWESLLAGGIGEKVLAWVIGEESTPAYFKIEINGDLLAAFTPCVEHARDLMLARFRARSETTGRVVSAIAQDHQQSRIRLGSLRFSDVPELLLASDAIKPDALSLALDASVSHVLLDEFQDTSIVQYRLLLPLIEEVLSVSPGERSFFCVGDPKQSLYRWRGAEPELFRALTSTFPQIQSEALTTNWRSSPIVLAAVDRALAHQPGKPFDAEVSGALGSFTGHTPQRTTRPGAAALIEVEPELPPADPDAKPKKPSTAICEEAIDSYVASRVAAVRAAAPWATIGVLVRRNSRVTRVLEALRDVGVDASEEAGSPLGASPGVAVLASLLHLVAFPSDTASHLHVALSPIGKRVGAGDPVDARSARHLSRLWRVRLARAGLARTVAAIGRAWMRAIGDAPDAAHQRSRFDAAHELAHAFEGEGRLDPGEFARVLRTRPVADGVRAPVTVLTVHKSKGLEFDAVFAVELDGAWARGRALVIERVDAQGRHDALAPIRRAFVRPNKAIERLSPELRAACEFQRTRALGEDVCGLYVAMTRAVHLLEMVVKPADNGASLNAARLLRQRLGGGEPVPIQSSAPGVAGARTLYQDGLHAQDAWAHAARIEREKDAAPEGPALRDVPLRINAAAQPPSWRRPAASPSSLEGGGRLSLGPIFAPRDDAPRRWGTLFHVWASLISWLDDGVPTLEQLCSVATSQGLVNAGDDTLGDARSFLDFVASDAAARTLARRAFAGLGGRLNVRTEWAYAAMVENAGTRRLLRGQFDRVVWGTDDAGKAQWAHVIDWKTDDAMDDAAIAQRVEFYSPQVNAYRQSLCVLLGLRPEDIGASLVLVGSQRVIAM